MIWRGIRTKDRCYMVAIIEIKDDVYLYDYEEDKVYSDDEQMTEVTTKTKIKKVKELYEQLQNAES